MKIIGMKKSDFQTKEGTLIKGYNVYLTYELSGDGAVGCGCERAYITQAKLDKCGFKPEVGDTVDLAYNRFGKVAAILPVLED